MTFGRLMHVLGLLERVVAIALSSCTAREVPRSSGPSSMKSLALPNA